MSSVDSHSLQGLVSDATIEFQSKKGGGYLPDPVARKSIDGNLIRLNQQQIQVILHICNGFVNKQIAHRMKLALHQIKDTRLAVMRLTGCKTPAQLGAWAVKQGLV